MPQKTDTAKMLTASPEKAEPKPPDIHFDPVIHPMMAELYHRAESLCRVQPKRLPSPNGVPKTEADVLRLLHELEVHQIELELQNAELQKARNELEEALEKANDLYDFAPVGYFSIDESGAILAANLTGATLMGLERSRLINRRIQLLLSPASRPVFLSFLEKVFSGPKDQACEALVLKTDGTTFWAGFQATSAVCPEGVRNWCRIAFMDITARKQAEEVQLRLEVMAETNRGLHQEIDRRRAVEQALQKSEQKQGLLLDQSRHMQAQLQQLTHNILHVQEEERKRISRELHDEIAQTLVGINVHLGGLIQGPSGYPKAVRQKIMRTQRLVEKSVEIVHRFARELRPTVLDDLGLIPALHAFLKEFTKRTGVRTHLTVFPDLEKLAIARRTILYRVAYEALNNVAHHAQASRVSVVFSQLPGFISMKIQDNGQSFSVARTLKANRGKRLGLVGMRERLEMVGGTFDIQSVPGNGTLILARIPSGPLRSRVKRLSAKK
jgi:PAS domain S-box-containing protein